MVEVEVYDYLFKLFDLFDLMKCIVKVLSEKCCVVVVFVVDENDCFDELFLVGCMFVM